MDGNMIIKNRRPQNPNGFFFFFFLDYSFHFITAFPPHNVDGEDDVCADAVGNAVLRLESWYTSRSRVDEATNRSSLQVVVVSSTKRKGKK